MQGWVHVPFRMKEFVRTALGNAHRDAPFRIFDITGSVEERRFVAYPVAINGKFERGHLRRNINLLPGEAVELVVAEHLIESVGNVEYADVTIARPAEIIGGEAVFTHSADRRGPHNVAIAVVVQVAVVEIGVEAELGGVARPDEILAIKIRNDYALVAIVERVQF